MATIRVHMKTEFDGTKGKFEVEPLRVNDEVSIALAMHEPGGGARDDVSVFLDKDMLLELIDACNVGLTILEAHEAANR